MSPDFPLTKDLVLIGGGHTHALVLRLWAMRALAGVRVTLINPGPTAPYTGMLPGYVAGHYDRDDLDIDLVRLAQAAGARMINGAVTGIDPAARLITVPGHPPIAYDVASVNVGITSAMPDLPGFAQFGIPAKPLDEFASRWDRFRLAPGAAGIAVIGGGVAGAELALTMAHGLRDAAVRPPLHLIDRGAVLASLGASARRKMLEVLGAAGVTLVPDAQVVAVGADHVALADGRQIGSGFTVGAAGARPHDWLAQIGVTLQDGYIAVDRFLQSSDPAIFAAGDCAALTHAPRPKAGVFAVREAPVLFDNLRAVLSGKPRRAYAPQQDYLKLISTGGKSALAERFGVALAGPMMWRWKDQIDQRFMRQFRELPQMARPALPQAHALGLREAGGDKPMCGGCGAKVGRKALLEVLGGPGDDAGLVIVNGARQVMSTDHLRAFWADPVVMTRIAAIHAFGDIWAMGAKPLAATVNLILPRMSADLQERTLREIMHAARQVITSAGAGIVGGHTSQGSELTIGFTLTGMCEAYPITLGGARPGDALVLTKPLGSGVIMAAAMAGKARGGDVISALEAMQQDQSLASAILCSAGAMTDVTGFGLAGHLAGICTRSGVAARLDLAAIPFLPGAVALAEQGVRSSLFDDNRAGAGVISGPQGASFDLLFDPQTAGGLLAAVPGEDAEALCRKIGAGAVVIGEITAGPPEITVI